MNKRVLVVSVLLLAAFFLLASCMINDATKAAELEGIWADEDSGDLFIEFNSDGSARLDGDDISTSMGSSYSWTVSDYYIDITAMGYLYSAEYVYELSEDKTTLYLYMTKYGMMNLSDYIVPGDAYVLTRQPEGMSFSEVLDSLDSSSYDYYW